MLPHNHLAIFIVDLVDKLDLSKIINTYNGRGNQAYHPSMMVSLLFFSYAKGIFSSRNIENLTYESIPYRYICANQHPDHSTISNFRLRFFQQLSDLFYQILEVAHEYGVLKLGSVSLDGTKIEANASKHKANSFEHAKKTAEKLKAEVAELLKNAEHADQIQLPDGFSIKDEVERRINKLNNLDQAINAIKERHKAIYKAEKEEYESKIAERDLKAQESGRKPGGRPPATPSDQPDPKSQYNFTDPDSRIMLDKRKGFVQGYNAQAAADGASRVVVAQHVSQNANDKLEMRPALANLKKLPERVGRPANMIGDAGYLSESNIIACQEDGIEPYIAVGRERHNPGPMSRFAVPEPPQPGATEKEKMQYKLKTPEGRKIYAQRKQVIEPIFGVIKSVIGFTKFSVRGLKKVSAEFNVVCSAYNLKRIHKLVQSIKTTE